MLKTSYGARVKKENKRVKQTTGDRATHKTTPPAKNGGVEGAGTNNKLTLQKVFDTRYKNV